MSIEKLTGKLIGILHKEQRLLEDYNSGSAELHHLVIRRDWEGLNEKIRLLRRQAESLSRHDQKREELTLKLKKAKALPEDTPFKDLMVHLEPDEQKQIVHLQTKIRQAVMTLQARLKGIDRYAEGQKNIIEETLKQAAPDSGGKIYNSDGTTSRHSSRSLLFNHRL